MPAEASPSHSYSSLISASLDRHSTYYPQRPSYSHDLEPIDIDPTIDYRITNIHSFWSPKLQPNPEAQTIFTSIETLRTYELRLYNALKPSWQAIVQLIILIVLVILLVLYAILYMGPDPPIGPIIFFSFTALFLLFLTIALESRWTSQRFQQLCTLVDYANVNRSQLFHEPSQWMIYAHANTPLTWSKRYSYICETITDQEVFGACLRALCGSYGHGSTERQRIESEAVMMRIIFKRTEPSRHIADLEHQ